MIVKILILSIFVASTVLTNESGSEKTPSKSDIVKASTVSKIQKNPCENKT